MPLLGCTQWGSGGVQPDLWRVGAVAGATRCYPGCSICGQCAWESWDVGWEWPQDGVLQGLKIQLKPFFGRRRALFFWQIQVGQQLPSGNLTVRYWKWPFLVDFPIKYGGSFHSYVSLPEGIFWQVVSPFMTFSEVTFSMVPKKSQLVLKHLLIGWVQAEKCQESWGLTKGPSKIP